jgi:hypothetical protein
MKSEIAKYIYLILKLVLPTSLSPIIQTFTSIGELLLFMLFVSLYLPVSDNSLPSDRTNKMKGSHHNTCGEYNSKSGHEDVVVVVKFTIRFFY